MSMLGLLAAGGGGPSGSQYPLPPATESDPYTSTALCTIHDTYGQGATVHPSVVDMGGKFSGYRWWMANTPYPNQGEVYENPCIYGSNDRVNWYPPTGLTNPIDEWPGVTYNSDTELVWDPDLGRLVCYYMHGGYVRMRSSTDGVLWSAESLVYQVVTEWSRSPAVVRVAAGQWRLYMLSTASEMMIATSTTSLGPFTDWQTTTGVGPANHGDVIKYSDGLWLAMARDSGRGISADGIAWTRTAGLPPASDGMPGTYRPTILPSTKDGFVDCWYGGFNDALPGGVGTAYTRIPLSAFGVS